MKKHIMFSSDVSCERTKSYKYQVVEYYLNVAYNDNKL